MSGDAARTGGEPGGADPVGRVLGAVLAGGRSRRFGTDKAFAGFRGMSLLERSIAALDDTCAEVVVVSSREEHQVPGRVRVPDLRADVGPLAGIEAALRHAQGQGADAVLVLACDLAGVGPGLARGLIDGLGDAPAVALERGGSPGFEPLCAVYRTSCADTASELLDGGTRAAHRLFTAVGGRVLRGARALVNVNTQDDLLRLERDPTVVCVIGKKKSGKTTTVVGLVAELVTRGHHVMTVKHGHGFDLDREGTDSWKHRNAGGASRVVLAGPDGFAVMGEWGREDGGSEPPLATLVRRHVSDADIVVAEGYKKSDFPCVEVFRSRVHETSLYGSGDAGEPARYLAVLTDVRDFEAVCPVIDVDAPDRFERLADLVEGHGG